MTPLPGQETGAAVATPVGDGELPAVTGPAPGREPTAAPHGGGPADADGRGPGRASRWALPAAAVVGAAPLLVVVLRLLALRPPVWLWGDEALTDIATIDVFRGHMLLGPYSRYGWHHPGPAWFLVLGAFRAIGGGSSLALLVGYLLTNVIVVALIVVVVWRWLGPRSGWLAAGLVAAFQWSFSFERLAQPWNPYAVALPGLLLVLLCARLAVAERPFPSMLGALTVASFMVQTDISTGLVVGALVVGGFAARGLRWLVRRRRARDLPAAERAPGEHDRRSFALRSLAVVAVLGALWVLPVYQEATQSPGNFSQLSSFFAGAHSGHHGLAAVRAVDTVWESFPLRIDAPPQVQDATPAALTTHSISSRPMLPLYLVASALLGALFVRRRAWMRASLAGATALALLAGTASAFDAQGPLYPYLVQWMQPLVIPVWLLAIDAGAEALSRRFGRARVRPSGPRWAIAVACAASAAAVVGIWPSAPASATSLDAARQAWQAAAPVLSEPSVHHVLVRPADPAGVPIAEVLADQALRAGKQVSVPSEDLYLFDPSFRYEGGADLELIVCCSAAYPPDTPGTRIVGYVNGNVPILARLVGHAGG